MSGFSGFQVMFSKELKDALRDRRAIMVAMVPSIALPIMMMLMFSTMAKTRSEATSMALPVIGAEYGPDLIDFLQRNDIVVEDFEGDPKAAISERTAAVILGIPDDFAESFARSEPAPVQVYADLSLDKSDAAFDRLMGLIEGYNQNIGSMRLMVRGVNPAVANPVRPEIKDFSTRSSRAGQLLGTMLMVILLAAFIGGAGVAIDTTAGERERHSLEPLLVHPLTSWQLVGGKWITVTVFSFAAVVVAVLSTAIAVSMFSLEGIGVDPQLTAGMQTQMLILLLPLSLFASSLQMLVSLFGKTFKEAQTYLSSLTMLPMVVVMASIFGNLKTATWMYAVPILGQQQLMMSVMRRETLDMNGAVVSGVVTSLLAVGVLALLARLLRSERVVYGN